MRRNNITSKNLKCLKSLLLFFKVYWISYNIAAVLRFGYSLGPEACGILAPWPWIEPSPPALEGESQALDTREVPEAF